MRDRDLTMRYEERFEVEGSDEWTAAMAEYNREADAITCPVSFIATDRGTPARFEPACHAGIVAASRRGHIRDTRCNP